MHKKNAKISSGRAAKRGFVSDAVVTSIVLPRELHDKLSEKAADRQISFSALVREELAKA